jgi:RNA polymerase sigma factor (sigma-70 family)
MDLDALVEQLRNGDASAGPMLVSIIAPRLLGYAAHLANDMSEADHEEIVEHAIEKAILKIDLFDPGRGTFSGWARTFVKNEVANWRRNRSGSAIPVADATPADLTETVPTGIEQPTPRDVAITALVLGLPEPSQLLLRLRFVEGLDHNAIANELGNKPAAVRKRLQRLLETLREQASHDPDLKHLGGE